MNKTLLSLFLLGIAFISRSQNLIFSGNVLSEDSLPVAFASIEITSANGVIANKVSAENGSFELLLPGSGAYKIKITHASYYDYAQELKIDSSMSSSVYILAKKDNTMAGVVVTATKPQLITRKIDRVVMNVQNNPLAAGKSSMDLFQLAPGVFVNNGTISINGVGGAKVMVNGRLLNLGGADLQSYLQNLKADDIKEIEIIAHPPAEYDAEGGAGMINIILKKNTRAGLNGSISASYAIGLGKYPNYGPSAALNYKKNKFSFNTSYSYGNEKSFQDVTQYRELTAGGNISTISDRTKYRTGNTMKAGAAYDISDWQYLAISYTGQFGNNTDSVFTKTRVAAPNPQDISLSRGAFPNNTKITYNNASINYDLQTDTLGSKFTFVADYTNNNRKGQSQTNSTTFNDLNEMIADTLYQFLFPSIAKIVTANAKYEKIFANNMHLSFGGKGSFTNIDNNNRYLVWGNNSWNNNAVPGFQYLYKEKIFAGFIDVRGRLKSFDYKLGLRGENSDVSALLTETNNDTTIAQNYFNLFPSIYLKKNLNKKGTNTLSFSYNRRISRPSYFDLNPYRYFIDNYTVKTGNPLLKPEFSNAFEIGSLWAGKYYIAFGYTQTTDIIKQVIEASLNDRQTTIIRKNAGTNNVAAITINAPLKPSKWWSSNNNLLLTYTEFKATEFNLSQTSFFFQTQNDFTITPTASLSLNGFYTPRVLTGNIVTGRVASLNLALQKSFWQRRLVSTVSLSDIFYSNNFKATSYYNNTTLSISQKEQTRLLTVSLVYNFNLGKSFKIRKQENSNAEEKNRLN